MRGSNGHNTYQRLPWRQVKPVNTQHMEPWYPAHPGLCHVLQTQHTPHTKEPFLGSGLDRVQSLPPTKAKTREHWARPKTSKHTQCGKYWGLNWTAEQVEKKTEDGRSCHHSVGGTPTFWILACLPWSWQIQYMCLNRGWTGDGQDRSQRLSRHSIVPNTPGKPKRTGRHNSPWQCLSRQGSWTWEPAPGEGAPPCNSKHNCKFASSRWRIHEQRRAPAPNYKPRIVHDMVSINKWRDEVIRQAANYIWVPLIDAGKNHAVTQMLIASSVTA